MQREFCARFESLHFDDKAAHEYGKIRTNLEKNGNIIGPNDLIIASIAVANNLTLITHNVKEFSRVEGLIYESWQE
jgi:tRNA(fMet)-specific endonuclease VapC